MRRPCPVQATGLCAKVQQPVGKQMEETHSNIRFRTEATSVTANTLACHGTKAARHVQHFYADKSASVAPAPFLTFALTPQNYGIKDT